MSAVPIHLLDHDVSTPMPSHDASEKAVLSALLQWPEKLDEIEGRISEDLFYIPAHRRIYRAIAKMRQNGVEPDPVNTQAFLQSSKEIEEVGGFSMVADLYTFIPTPKNLNNYVDELTKSHALRHLVAFGTDVANRSINREIEDLDSFVDGIETTALSIREMITGKASTCQRSQETLLKYIEAIESGEINKGGLKLWGNIQGVPVSASPGDLVLIGARPSVGKTSAANTLINYHCVEHGVPAVAFLAEGTHQAFVARQVSMRCGIPYSHQKRLMEIPHKSAKPAMWEAVQDVAKAPLYTDDRGLMTVPYVRSVAREKAREFKGGLDGQPWLLIIDYIQLLYSGDARSDSEIRVRISSVSSALKALAKELGCVVVALAQLNRGPEGRSDPTPKMSDLRESGQLEQDADHIYMLHRPSMGDDLLEEDDAELIHVKGRDTGAAGTIGMTYTPRTQHWRPARTPTPSRWIRYQMNETGM